MAMARTVEDLSAELGAELKALREELRAVIDTVKELGARQAAGAADAVRETVDEATARLRSSAGDARRQGEAMAHDFAEVVARRPGAAMLAAMSLGYLLGKLRH